MTATRYAEVHVLSAEDMTSHYCDPEEIEEFAAFLGIDTELDRDLLWLAEEGLLTAPAEPWKACQTTDSMELFFYNFETGESVWEHPGDADLRRRIQEELQKRVLVPITLASTRLGNGAWGIIGTNLAGDEVCRVRVALEGDEAFAGMEDQLRAQLTLPSGSIPRFLRSNATVLGHSHRHVKVKELFEAPEELTLPSGSVPRFVRSVLPSATQGHQAVQSPGVSPADAGAEAAQSYPMPPELHSSVHSGRRE
jgi:hypothetical protein